MTDFTCSFEGCSKRRKTRGLCNGHNEQRRKGKPLTPLRSKSFASINDKYEALVIRGDGCWGWAGVINDSGYAVIAKDHVYHRAHRYAWERVNGPIPDGAEVDHICHTRECTRTDHLRVVNRTQNNQNRIGANSNSKTGVRNVYRRGNKFRVTLTVGGKSLVVGSYATLEEAANAASEARMKYYTHSPN